jgi:hypothetical protein
MVPEAAARPSHGTDSNPVTDHAVELVFEGLQVQAAGRLGQGWQCWGAQPYCRVGGCNA